MEISDLQFRHYTLREVQLPTDAFVRLGGVDLDTVAICCDLERHVFYAAHTDPEVAEALRATHWYELAEWTSSGPGNVSLG